MLTDFALANEPIFRAAIFFLVLAIMATWELLMPRRAQPVMKLERWANNLGLLLIDSFLVRIFFPAAAVGFAVFAQGHGMGLLRILKVPDLAALAAGIMLLDFAIYLQHLIFHAVPLLWRVHRVHHADPDFDVTTGTRFHPIEILLSMGIKFLLIVTLGPPVLAVLIFETLLNVTAMFNHSNVAIPNGIDRALRYLLVTPDMHRIHHSINQSETNSNFGFCFSLWDRVLGTYKHAPALGHVAMTIGVSELRDRREIIALRGMLAIPFSTSTQSKPLDIRSNEPV